MHSPVKLAKVRTILQFFHDFAKDAFHSLRSSENWSVKATISKAIRDLWCGFFSLVHQPFNPKQNTCISLPQRFIRDSKTFLVRFVSQFRAINWKQLLRKQFFWNFMSWKCICYAKFMKRQNKCSPKRKHLLRQPRSKVFSARERGFWYRFGT